MAEIVVADIVLKGNGPSKQQVADLAATLTQALQARKLAGAALQSAVAAAERQATKEEPTKQAIDVAKLPFAQAFKDTFGAAAAEAELEVTSADAKARVAAALDVLAAAHTGHTLCYTPHHVRPKILDYQDSYTNGLRTPKDMAERVIAFLEKHNEACRFLSAYDADNIRAQAAQSAARWAGGKVRSVFDGVPFVVKDDIDAVPYATSRGTSFMGRAASTDAPCVATLRSLGAILIGKAAMPELGVQAGANSSATRNPQNPAKTAGGASAGCCAAVAAGLCPIAIGTDAGGATALPASFCGVVGLKPSSGRLADAAPRGASSLACTTPIANSTGDLMLLYAALANTPNAGEKKAPKALALPAELLALAERAAINNDFVLAGNQPLAGTKIGLAKQWVEQSDKGVRDIVEQTVARLESLGASIVDVSLPQLEQIQASHLVTLSKEAAADSQQLKEQRGQLAMETRMFLANAAKVTVAEYTQAQRLRASILSGFEAALKEVDVILSPAAPCVAPDMDASGVYDMAATSAQTRFALGASLTGLPALVLPAGREMGFRLPIGMQLIGKPWGEAALLRFSAALEQRLLEDGYPCQVARLQVNPIESAIGTHPIAARVTKETWAVRYRYNGEIVRK